MKQNKNGILLLGLSLLLAGCSTEIAPLERWDVYSGSIVLWAPGILKEARLRRNVNINGIPCKAGEKIWFYENGNLRKAVLSETIPYQGIFCQGDQRISFHEDASLNKCFIAKDMDINGWTFHIGDELDNYQSGEFKALEVYTATSVQDYHMSPGDTVEFYRTAELKSITLNNIDPIINGISFLRGEAISFYSNGSLQSGVLAEDTEINGTNYMGYLYIEFDEEGKVSL